MLGKNNKKLIKSAKKIFIKTFLGTMVLFNSGCAFINDVKKTSDAFFSDKFLDKIEYNVNKRINQDLQASKIRDLYFDLYLFENNIYRNYYFFEKENEKENVEAKAELESLLKKSTSQTLEESLKQSETLKTLADILSIDLKTPSVEKPLDSSKYKIGAEEKGNVLQPNDPENIKEKIEPLKFKLRTSINPKLILQIYEKNNFIYSPREKEIENKSSFLFNNQIGLGLNIKYDLETKNYSGSIGIGYTPNSKAAFKISYSYDKMLGWGIYFEFFKFIFN